MSGSGDSEVVAASYGSRLQGETAQGFLEDAGIESALVVDDAGSAVPGVSMGFAPARLLVRGSDLDRARDVLREAGMLEEEPGES